MEGIFKNCAGIDVHKSFLIVCWQRIDEGEKVRQEKRRFETMTADLNELATWLLARGCTHVAIESTGVYWQPVYNVLEEHLTVWLVNAKHVQNVPGRKTDLSDAEWLAQLMQHGLLKPSFIPERSQCELRDLVRYRITLVDERSRVVNRLQKVLEDANIKLAAVVSDMQGTSAQAMIRALVAGATDPRGLANLACGRLRTKIPDLERALQGRMRPHHCILLTELLLHLDFLDERIHALERTIEQQLVQLPAFQLEVARLETITGVSRLTAVAILAETGIDMSRFPSAANLIAWAGLAPGNNESAGKQRSTRTRQGNRYLRRALVQAAWAATRTKNAYLKALYHRLAARRGRKRALIAVARTILQAAYFMVLRQLPYQDLGAAYFDKLDKQRTSQRLVRRLESLGFVVNIQAAPLPTPA